MRRLAVVNGPNIFQMLLVIVCCLAHLENKKHLKNVGPIRHC